MTQSRYLVAGNWKMNTTVAQGEELVDQLLLELDAGAQAEVVILPPFTHLDALHKQLAASSIALGAQDCFWETKGAFTGEISPATLAELCKWVLVGHSERRHLLGETDEDVTRKLRAALGAGLHVIVAVGETQQEREDGVTREVIDRQLGSLFGLAPDQLDRIAVAYEPVWAIGTGLTATPEQAEEVCKRISEHLDGQVRVLYGGSVTAENAAELFACEHVSGALVGGASLKVADFAAIVTAAK